MTYLNDTSEVSTYSKTLKKRFLYNLTIYFDINKNYGNAE